MTETKSLRGLDGWLALVGIGVVIAPIRLVYSLVSTYKPLFEDGSWEALTTVGSEAYNPAFSSIIIGEVAFNSILILASIVLVYMYFSRHYVFPRLYIGIAAASLVFIPLDAWLVTRAFPSVEMFDPETSKEFARSLIAAVIWIPYMLVSQRVKATFVEKRPGQHEQATPESFG